MICSSCYLDTPAAKLYCTHCGTEQNLCTGLLSDFDRRMQERGLFGIDAPPYSLSEVVEVLEGAAEALVAGGHNPQQVAGMASILVSMMFTDRLQGVQLRWYPAGYYLA